MSLFLWNIMLALAWAGLNREITMFNLLVGFGIGYLILFVVRAVIGPSAYFTKVRKFIDLACFFAYELVLANLRIAYEVMTPTLRMKPGVIAIPLDAKTDAEIILLANLITLTPGTLSLDVSSDRRVLYIHAMYVDNVESLRHSIKSGFERKVLELLR